MTRALQYCLPVLLVLFNLLGTPAWAQANPPALQILIVEGDGAINNIKQRVNREPIVQVEDQNHKPIAGAAVIFFLPNQGPGGTFANGASELTTTTNAEGRAIARGIRLNRQSGSMEIRVTASYQGQTVSAVIQQTNVLGAGAAGSAASAGLSLTAKVLFVLGVVGAAAVAGGVYAATRGGGSSSSTVTLTPGTPTVGAP
jgi:hypothetical protein